MMSLPLLMMITTEKQLIIVDQLTMHVMCIKQAEPHAKQFGIYGNRHFKTLSQIPLYLRLTISLIFLQYSTYSLFSLLISL